MVAAFPLAIADAPLALLAIAGLLFGVWVMSRGPRATDAVAPPADDAPAPSPPPAASPLAPVPARAPEPEPELEQLPRTTFRQGDIKLVGSTPEPAPEPAPLAPDPAPAPPPGVPPTTFRQGRIRLGWPQRGPDDPPG
ncbi:MAG TPA: hypothetical protein VMY78_06800 [Solirubrobacteraceae bacterium]|nr:hypothetical protein [Solirubrobacteraceae bacterium]